ncbi:PKD domain protein [compost metagenome]
MLVSALNAPNANFLVQNTYTCSTDSVLFQNTSVDAVSYSWIIEGGVPAVSNSVNPKIRFENSGSYSVKLIAYGLNTSDTVQQLVNVSVSLPVSAQFEMNEEILYLPDAVLNCTNSSLQANGYWWNFGDGSESQDENPSHTYTAEGVYEVKLIAANDACSNDTLTRLIHVVDVAGLGDLKNMKWSIYPNPAKDVLTIAVDAKYSGGFIRLTDCLGRTVMTGKLASDSISLDIGALANGVYQLSYELLEQSIQQSIIKY